MDVTIRELTPPDLTQGFLETLSTLAEITLTAEQAHEIFHNRRHNGVCTFVAVDGERVVGTVSLMVEQKYIHAGASCGHIEDVVVHPDYKHRGIGAALIEHATKEAGKRSCYKVILNCYDALVPFYTHCGYRRHDNGMRKDIADA